jgi:hypothetical protein
MAARRCPVRQFARVDRQAQRRVVLSRVGSVQTVEIAADVSVVVTIAVAMDVDVATSVTRSVDAVMKLPGRRDMSRRRWIRLRL